MPQQQRRRTLRQQHRERFAEVGLSDDQQRRLDALDDERQSWRAEHEEALRALQDELAVARRDGDEAALADGRARMRALWETMPSLQEILTELSDEQRARLGRKPGAARSGNPRTTPRAAESDEDRQLRIQRRTEALARRRQQRFAGAGLSQGQQRRIEGLGEARRVWNAEHREELQALRAEIVAAQQSGDDAGVEASRARIEALRATAPGMGDLLAELSDEQRAQIRARRPTPRQRSLANDASPQAGAAPDARAAD